MRDTIFVRCPKCGAGHFTGLSRSSPNLQKDVERFLASHECRPVVAPFVRLAEDPP
ncbi:MAG: hypothetical protein WAN74_00665 [Thermoplasmata archaeon]